MHNSYDFLSNFAATGDSLAYRSMSGYDEKYVADIPQLSARGMLTGTATYVLGDTTMLVRSLYYDHHGNVIQTHETNMLGGTDHTYSHLSFTGKPLQVMQVHTTADTTLTDVYFYTYDNMERLLTASVAHDSGTAVQLAANTYDELGRLASRQLGGTAAGLSEYAYNVRGWTTAISNPNFSQTLHYQDEFTGATPCYNGNISAMEWQARDAMMAAAPTRHHYSYSYDGMNRLTAASHGTTDAATWSGHLAVPAHCPRNYSCSYQYDSNGNLTALTRKGVSQVTTAGMTTVWQYGTIDDLSLTYDGNIWFIHTDQLGSSTLVTDGNGQLVQQIEYLPYGEVFLERQNGDFTTPYKFNGKELDEETGLYYYGARYMNPRLSIWYGCDPLQEKYPNVSSYAYCAGNPVILFDYNGEEPDEIEAARMSDFVSGKGDVKLIGGWQPSTITFGDVLLNEDESGFKSMIFERTTNGKTEYAYAFAGTDITSGKDWRNNLQQIYGNSRQYRLAIQNAVNLKKDLQGAELTFVGHSLGGGLAAASAYATGGRALTFNAAGVSPNTIKPNRLAKIDAYINYRDELNILQFGTTVAPKVNGHIHVRFGDAAILGHDIKNFYKPPIHKQLYDSAQDKVMRVINKLGDALIPKNPTLF